LNATSIINKLNAPVLLGHYNACYMPILPLHFNNNYQYVNNGGGDDNLNVKIVQLPPLFKAKVWRYFGFNATKNHQLLLMATIYPCFYFCFVLLSEMLRLTLLY